MFSFRSKSSNGLVSCDLFSCQVLWAGPKNLIDLIGHNCFITENKNKLMNDLLLYHNNWFTCTISMASSKKMKDAIFFPENLPKEP